MAESGTNRVWSRKRRYVVGGARVVILLVAVLLGIVVSGHSASVASDPVVAAAGDIACDPANSNFNGGDGRNGACQQKATYDVLTQIDPTAVLALGDNQYYCGGYQAFLQSYALSWGMLLSKTYPAVGNHEYLTSGGTGCDSTNAGAAGYFKYYAGAAQEGNAGQGYYSFDVGSWHLIAVNSNCSNAGGCGTSSPQGKWLAGDLAAHPNQCLLAFWHIPLWSSGGRASRNTASIVQQLYNAGADVILNGHDHIYERFAPQNASGQLDTAAGVREFIVGTGGANHTSIAFVAPNSEVRLATTFGVLKLTLHPSGYDWAFVPVGGGQVMDAGSQACHNTGVTSGPPSAPTLTLSGDASDFVSGSTVFYRQGSAGTFTVSASSAGATSMQFPDVFGGDGGTASAVPFTHSYSWGSSATASGSFAVTAGNPSGTSPPSQFTLSPDTTAPSTVAVCNQSSCSGSYSSASAVTVGLTSTDAGAGIQAVYYTLDGSDPGSSPSRIRYTGPFLVSSSLTVRYAATDNVGNQEMPHSLAVTVAGGTSVALVQQQVTNGSTAKLSVGLAAPSAAGDLMVATVALAAGSSASVSSVTDSSGVVWAKGPVGFLTGTNSRIEIWYRLSAPPISSLTITLSASKRLAVNVSEWSGIASGTAVDGSAGGKGASSKSTVTPSLATTSPIDLVLAATNYPAGATSMLDPGPFTSLNDFSNPTSVHGRLAYLVTTTSGSYSAAWTLSIASGGNGTAILAFRAAATGP